MKPLVPVIPTKKQWATSDSAKEVVALAYPTLNPPDDLPDSPDQVVYHADGTVELLTN
jgi:hypothetical protein